jgi:hypothetical protein
MEEDDKCTTFEVEMGSLKNKAKPPERFLNYKRHHTTLEEIDAKQSAAEERRKVGLFTGIDKRTD